MTQPVERITPRTVVDGVQHIPMITIDRIVSGGWRWQASCCDTWRANGEIEERVMQAVDYLDSPTEFVRRIVLGYAWRNHILNVMSRNRAENKMHLLELYDPECDLCDPIKVSTLDDQPLEEIKRKMAAMTDDIRRAHIRWPVRGPAHAPRGELAWLFGSV